MVGVVDSSGQYQYNARIARFMVITKHFEEKEGHIFAHSETLLGLSIYQMIGSSKTMISC